jgi:hypothetical protein
VIAPALATEEVEDVVEYVTNAPGYGLDGLKQDLAYLANTNRVTDLGSPGVISALAAIASRGGEIARHINNALRVVVGQGVLGSEEPVEEIWTDKARRIAAEWGEGASGLRERATEAWEDVKRLVRSRSGHEEIENRALEMLPLMAGQEEEIAGELIEAGPAWVAAESAANRRAAVAAAISNVLNDLRHSGWMVRDAIGRAISNIRAPSSTTVGQVAVTGSAVGFLGVVIKEVLKLLGPEVVRVTPEGPQPPTAPGADIKEDEDDDEDQNIPAHTGEHPSEEKVDDVFELPPVADMPLEELKRAEQEAKEETPFEVPMNLINSEYDLSNTMVRRSLAEQGLYYSGKLWVPNYTPQVPPRVDFSDQKMTASVNQSVVVNMPMQPTYQAKPNKRMNAFQGPEVELRDVPKVKLPKYKTPYDTLFRRNEFLYPGH